MNGYVQVYTGNGKGKSTAAFGLCIRAAGAGLNVFIGQFLKKGRFSEHRAFERFRDGITIRQFGRRGFVFGAPMKRDRDEAMAGLHEIEIAISSGEYDVVVLDEINVAVHYGLIPVSTVLSVIQERPKNIELVLTGRYAAPEIKDIADLVTEMVEVKHYFHRDVSARLGIER